jgi:hypothetical protein
MTKYDLKKRQFYMAQLSDEVKRLGGHPGKIDWDTATYLYNAEVDFKQAAEKIVVIQGQHI